MQTDPTDYTARAAQEGLSNQLLDLSDQPLGFVTWPAVDGPLARRAVRRQDLVDGMVLIVEGEEFVPARVETPPPPELGDIVGDPSGGVWRRVLVEGDGRALGLGREAILEMVETFQRGVLVTWTPRLTGLGFDDKGVVCEVLALRAEVNERGLVELHAAGRFPDDLDWPELSIGFYPPGEYRDSDGVPVMKHVLVQVLVAPTEAPTSAEVGEPGRVLEGIAGLCADDAVDPADSAPPTTNAEDALVALDRFRPQAERGRRYSLREVADLGGFTDHTKARMSALSKALARADDFTRSGKRGGVRWSVAGTAPASKRRAKGSQPREVGSHPAVDALKAIRESAPGEYSVPKLAELLAQHGWSNGTQDALLVADDYDLEWVRLKAGRVVVAR